MRLWTIKSRFLWVLKENIRARHFYERLGFSLTDKFIDNIGDKDLREVQYIYSVCEISTLPGSCREQKSVVVEMSKPKSKTGRRGMC